MIKHHHTFRCGDNCPWLPAERRAEREGIKVSDVLRDALRQYGLGIWSPRRAELAAESVFRAPPAWPTDDEGRFVPACRKG